MYTEKNTERSERIKKIAATALGVAGTVAVVRNGKLGKNIDKFMGDIGASSKGVFSDLSVLSRKELTAENIGASLKRRILNEDSQYKNRRRSTKREFEIDTRRGAVNDIIGLRNLAKGKLNIQSRLDDQVVMKEALNTLMENTENGSKEFYKQMQIMMDEALNNQGKFFKTIDKDGEEFIRANQEAFSKRLKGSLGEEHQDTITMALEDALARADDLRENNRKLAETTQENAMEELFQNTMEKYGRGSKAHNNKNMTNAATVNDVLRATHDGDFGSKILNDSLEKEDGSFIEFLQGLVDKNADFGEVVLDENMLKKAEINELATERGVFEIYSLSNINKTKDAVLNETADTIFGKLFNMRSFIDSNQAPSAIMFDAGTFDKKIASALDSGESGIISRNVFKLGDKFYEATDAGEMKHLEALDNTKVFSGRHGSVKVMYNSMMGNTSYKPAGNKMAEAFDFNTAGKNFWTEFKSRFTKFKKDSTWSRNQFYKIKDWNRDLGDDNNLYEALEAIDDINSLFNTNARGVSNRTVSELSKIVSKDSKKLLKTLTGSRNTAKSLINLEDINLKNKNLELLLNQFNKDANAIKEVMQIGSGAGGTNVIKFEELLNREVVKEVMLRESKRSNKDLVKGFQTVSGKLRSLDISGSEHKKINELFSWTILQDTTDSYAKSSHAPISEEFKRDAIESVRSMLNSSSKDSFTDSYLKDFHVGLKGFIDENSNGFEAHLENDFSIQKGFRNNDYIAVGKTVSPLEMLREMNEGIKARGGKDFAKQFVAGRNNPEDLTTASLISYHMVNRLMSPLENLGLGFSHKSNGSLGELVKNIGIKRVAPAIGLIHTAGYLNYEARNITGTSFTGAALNVKAQFTMGIKNIEGALGMDEMRERENDYNPIKQYLFGEHQSAEEYRDYLYNGYDPVRKGRWWSFGSASEFRGGKIAYWQPNAHRRDDSNYMDVALYGSSEEKWKRSWLPSLRHPFSPLRAMANPYWLEEKHYWDRPYPVSGKLFGEGAPWSGVLNATVGEAIKPQKRMHQEEMRGGLTDVRDIIAERNREIMERSTENRVARIDQSGFTPMTFLPESQPSLNEAVYTLRESGGKVQGVFEGQNYAESLQDIENLSFANNGLIQGGSAGKGRGGAAALTYSPQNLSVDGAAYASMETDKVTGTLVNDLAIGLLGTGAVNSNEGLNMIAAVNEQIKINDPMARPEGALLENAREGHSAYYDARDKAKVEYLESFEAVNNIGDIKSDFADIAFSAKQLSGIYGFMFDAVVPESKSYQLENANMSSFSRTFWDASVGGHGGGFMEIARRFFPHENRAIERINNIRNTQPLWLPTRFHHGDPYTAIPKGEARLPGAGYEALNKLHSDQYGKYGAFDRYKILADVSPMTAEYKTWKQIAEETVTDPVLKKRMAEIDKRVQEQNKEHDFYNYKFIGKGLERKSAVIESVTNTGQFTVRGDETTYQLAGIKPLKDEAGESYVHQYLTPGATINLSYDKNEYSRTNKKGHVVALVHKGNESVTREMFSNKHAIENEYKDTLTDEYFNLSEGNIKMGHVFEAIGHAQIPYLHNKFLRIDSSKEAYEKEQVYGSSFATWDNPIEGFIKPAFETAFSKGPLQQAIGLGASVASMYVDTTSAKGMTKTGVRLAANFMNPAAFTGGMIGGLTKLTMGTGASKLINYKTGSVAGAAIGVGGYALSNLHNPILSAANFGLMGLAANEQFKFFDDVARGTGNRKAMAIGAVTGLALSALKNPDFDWDRMTGRYIPKDTQRKWEIEEYYDRLEYMKYSNLYQKSARLAKRKEGVDIEKIINKFEYTREENDKKRAKLVEQIEKAKKRISDTGSREKVIANLNGQIRALDNQEQYFQMGEYTKSALSYKKAMDNTIYGLNKHSSNADILRALPKYDRDFFMDFGKIKDPKEQKEILKIVSPYKAKALKILWGQDEGKQESNYEYFQSHQLPGLFWSGWNPNVDLANVQMKTIENEGMMLSDFGFYDSAKSEPAAIAAPEIRNFDQGTSMLSLQKNVIGLMNGIDLQGLEVSVEPSNTEGLNFVTNVVQTASYNLQNKVNNALYTIF